MFVECFGDNYFLMANSIWFTRWHLLVAYFIDRSWHVQVNIPSTSSSKLYAYTPRASIVRISVAILPLKQTASMSNLGYGPCDLFGCYANRCQQYIVYLWPIKFCLLICKNSWKPRSQLSSKISAPQKKCCPFERVLPMALNAKSSVFFPAAPGYWTC